MRTRIESSMSFYRLASPTPLVLISDAGFDDSGDMGVRHIPRIKTGLCIVLPSLGSEGGRIAQMEPAGIQNGAIE